MKNNVTLIGDWGSSEPYVAMLKGRLFSRMEEVNVFDIHHSIPLGNNALTAFLLAHTYSCFPQHTVHLVLTNVSETNSGEPLAVSVDGHFFVAPNSGVLPMMFYEQLGDLTFWKCVVKEGGFVERMITMACACQEGRMEEVADVCTDYKISRPLMSDYDPVRRKISGHIIHIDEMGNVITNIPVGIFRKAMEQNSRFQVGIGRYAVTRFHESYQEDVAPYILPNSLGVMEVAAYNGRVALVAQWEVMDEIEVQFFEN